MPEQVFSRPLDKRAGCHGAGILHHWERGVKPPGNRNGPHSLRSGLIPPPQSTGDRYGEVCIFERGEVRQNCPHRHSSNNLATNSNDAIFRRRDMSIRTAPNRTGLRRRKGLRRPLRPIPPLPPCARRIVKILQPTRHHPSRHSRTTSRHPQPPRCPTRPPCHPPRPLSHHGRTHLRRRTPNHESLPTPHQ